MSSTPAAELIRQDEIPSLKAKFEGTPEQISAVLDIHRATLGGTLSLTGTPERGRVTVYAPVTQNIVVDFDWHTMTIAEARGQAGAAA